MQQHDIDNWVTLIAAIFRRAIRDAKLGKKDALHFLDHTFPEWRQMETQRDNEGRQLQNRQTVTTKKEA